MAKRTIKGRSFSYLNNQQDHYVTVMRGGEVDTNDLSEREIELALENDMFEEEDEDAGASDVDIAAMSVEDLAAYIEDNELNVGATVALAGDDPDLAEHVLSAEDTRSGGEPRKGVEDGLNKIIGE